MREEDAARWIALVACHAGVLHGERISGLLYAARVAARHDVSP